MAALWLLSLVSFAPSVLWMRSDEADAAFYLLPARAWELLLGALVALNGVPQLKTRRMRNIASLIGVGAIIAVAGAYNRNVPFPGWTALVPCIAAALIIHSGSQRDTWVYAVLSTRRLGVRGIRCAGRRRRLRDSVSRRGAPPRDLVISAAADRIFNSQMLHLAGARTRSAILGNIQTA